MKLIDLLKEVGEATAKPYDWRQTSDEEEYKEYMFKTDSGLNYQLDIEIKEQDEERDTAAVSFGVVKPNDDDQYFKDYDETPSRGEVYKVMATVVGILKDFIKKSKGIKYLHFTTNKVGPGETKRLGLYKQYIQKHLPNADIETKNRYGAEVTTITLKEIGDASAKPYRWDWTIEDGDKAYVFYTDSGERYVVVVDVLEAEDDPFTARGLNRLDVKFGTTSAIGQTDFDKVPSKGELYKVMATVVDIVKQELDTKGYIKAIEFSPSKRKDKGKDKLSNARVELYKRFLKNFYPNVEYQTYGDEVIAILKK